MRRIADLTASFVLSCALMFGAWQSFAQLTSTGAGKKAGGGGASYTGLGDLGLSGLAAYWGLRAYSSATRGNKAINVCNVSDVACADLSTDATTGNLTIGTVGGSSCAVITCTIKTIYDQSPSNICSGVCDLTQATIGSRPTLVTSCIGSLPCMACNGSQSASVTFPTIGQPYFISGVAKRTSGSGFADVLGFNTAGQVQFLFNNSANNFTIYAGTVGTPATAADGSFHAVSGNYNGASSTLGVNGASTTVNAGAASATGTTTICSNNNSLTGSVAELAFWNLGNASSVSALSTNQHSYWGF